MAEHYTKSTLECHKHCKKCGAITRHRVLCGKAAGCLDCEAKYKPAPKKEAPAQQLGLFKIKVD